MPGNSEDLWRIRSAAVSMSDHELHVSHVKGDSVMRHPTLLGLFVAALLPSVANAQEAPATVQVAPAPATVTTQETTSQATGPSLAMVGSGVAIFGLSYLPAVVVGAVSGLSADRALFVPLAGPWVDLTQRPGCPAGASCNAETTNKVLLVADGIFQAIGALTIIGGFLTPAHRTKTVTRTADLRPTVRLSPAQLGNGGYGMMALGTF
jgi:hypothetical protein